MLRQVLEAYDLLDSAHVTGKRVARALRDRGLEDVEVYRVEGDRGSTDVVKVVVPGRSGRLSGGGSPTLGIIGMVGGVGARPERIGLVSDADGVMAAIAVALKLADMRRNGDVLDGDVIITTHVSPRAPIVPHHPVPFIGSPIDVATLVRRLVDSRMDAILSVDTTKGNRVINIRGFAITPTVKEGWILKVSDDLLDIMEYVTGRMPAVVPITMQDITPYGNGVYHLNSMMQPATVTKAPVVGVAITAEVPVPGSATGASRVVDIEEAARFCVEVAKGFGRGEVKFYDEEEFKRLVELYGPMNRLQALGVQG